MISIDEVLNRLTKLSPEDRAAVEQEALEATKHLQFIPSPGPQTDAYFSDADVLLFGGEPGGGKSALLVGLALNCHENALLMRRQYTDLDALTEEAIKVNGSREGFNGSPPPSLRHKGGKIDFGACARPGDEQHWMGRPHDLLGIDEATQFSAKQIRFLRGWLRTTTQGQRTRTVLATNPPLTAEGLWVHEMFAPWLNPQHPKPAKPGELRWFVVDRDDRDIEVPGPGLHVIDGKEYEAESRTYIPSRLSDNPFLAGTDYQKRLDALPAEIRDILLGGFKTSFRDAPNQTIPTAWVQMAQERWRSQPPEGIPMCAMGVDASGGGDDPMMISPRYDGWFAPLIEVPGRQIPVDRIGPYCAGLVVSYRKHDALVVVDMGGGYGGSMHDHLVANSVEVIRYRGAEGTTRRSRDGKMKFTNVRSAAYWLFREALDPAQEGGSPIGLPDDPALVADLTAPTFEMTPNGIKVEAKEKVCERLGRSTDRGDAAVMSWWSGPKMPTHYQSWQADQRVTKREPVVDMGARFRHR